MDWSRPLCCHANASRTIVGMVAGLTIWRAILVSGIMVEAMSTIWNRACLRLRMPFCPVIMIIGIAASRA